MQILTQLLKHNFGNFYYYDCDASIDDSFMVEDIGKNLSKPERLTAFALASEVCASNFNISDDEINFLILLKQKWDIPKTVVESVFTSLNLRYGIPKTKDRI